MSLFLLYILLGYNLSFFWRKMEGLHNISTWDNNKSNEYAYVAMKSDEVLTLSDEGIFCLAQTVNFQVFRCHGNGKWPSVLRSLVCEFERAFMAIAARHRCRRLGAKCIRDLAGLEVATSTIWYLSAITPISHTMELQWSYLISTV